MTNVTRAYAHCARFKFVKGDGTDARKSVASTRVVGAVASFLTYSADFRIPSRSDRQVGKDQDLEAPPGT
jgi:hypothetical protein